MRVISKFKDFYDIGGYVGYYNRDIDPKEKVFHRETESLEYSDNYIKDPFYHDIIVNDKMFAIPFRDYTHGGDIILVDTKSNTTRLYYAYDVLYYCGKAIPFVKFTTGLCGPDTYCYSHDDVDKFIDGLKEEYKISEKFFTFAFKDLKRKREFDSIKKIVKEYLDGIGIKSYKNERIMCVNEIDSNRLLKYHMGLQTPYFIYERKYMSRDFVITINPSLSDMQLYKLKDCYFAHQEISQFYDNVLTDTENGVPAMDDVTLAKSKGFDKFSFRKDKQNKKKGKKKRES